MNYFAFRVKENNTDLEAAAGCWIVAETDEAAYERAMRLVESSGWYATELLEQYHLSRNSYDDDAEGLVYYEQALIDEEVMVVFIPKVPEDDRS